MHVHYRHVFVLMQRVQDAVIDGYNRYQFVQCSAAKAAQLARQFAAEYETEISKQARYRRKMAGIARARFFSIEKDGIVTGFLMATDGKGLIGREAMHDPTKKRITLGSYELAHDGVGWSWQFTADTVKQWRKRVHDTIARDNLAQLLTTVRHLYRSAGFRIVRKQIGQLANYIRGEWRRLRKGAPPDLPTFLYYMRRLPDDWTPATAPASSTVSRGKPQRPNIVMIEKSVQAENCNRKIDCVHELGVQSEN